MHPLTAARRIGGQREQFQSPPIRAGRQHWSFPVSRWARRARLTTLTGGRWSFDTCRDEKVPMRIRISLAEKPRNLIVPGTSTHRNFGARGQTLDSLDLKRLFGTVRSPDFFAAFRAGWPSKAVLEAFSWKIDGVETIHLRQILTMASTSTSRKPRNYRTSDFSRERNRMHARKTRQVSVSPASPAGHHL